MTLNEIAEGYVRAALALDRHDPGFVDAYFGPPEWKEEAAGGDAVSPVDLDDQVADLRTALAGHDATFPRVAFLAGQLGAIATRLRMLAGESLSFVDEVEGLYGFTPVRYPEEEFERIHGELEGLVPGTGDLSERVARYDRRFLVETDRILPLFERAAAECRRRSARLLPLPRDERINLRLVSEKPWGAYNWYQGGGTSNIEINTDLPRRANTILHYVAHEGYPGHHTELSTRDALLARQEGWPEYGVYPLYSPQSHISEGGADLGIELIFEPGEVAGFYRETVLPAAGITDVDVERMLEIMRLRGVLSHADENAAFMLFEDGTSDDEAEAYLRRWALLTAEEAAKRIEFIRSYRGYVFNYRTGYELVRGFVTGGGAPGNVQKERFRHIWTTPVTPDMLVRWTDTSGPAR
jgi:hypothetical protein